MLSDARCGSLGSDFGFGISNRVVEMRWNSKSKGCVVAHERTILKGPLITIQSGRVFSALVGLLSINQ